MLARDNSSNAVVEHDDKAFERRVRERKKAESVVDSLKRMCKEIGQLRKRIKELEDNR